MIPFSKFSLLGNEKRYIEKVLEDGKISGDGYFTKKCNEFFENEYGFKKVLLTTSCTDALEMSAILCDIKPGDEVIAPSYTISSTVNPFLLRGAKIVFADSEITNPNIDLSNIKKLINKKTKAIVVVHYAGVSCDMDKIIEIAKKYNLFIIEDAAQAIDSFYKNKRVGSFGHFSTFSFHETKNLSSGEGGLLVINDETFNERAEIIREKGTNRSLFFRGEIDKYNWVDIGSSFLPSDIIAAILYAQLENLKKVQDHRRKIWDIYYNGLYKFEKIYNFSLPFIPEYSSNNGHMFYIICESLKKRTELIKTLRENGIQAVFHYQSLHNSPYFLSLSKEISLPNAKRYTDCLLRLPMFNYITEKEATKVVNTIINIYSKTL